MPSTAEPRRVLLAILVYNGQEFVPHCLDSARAVIDRSPGTDVLVLDDCSPEPGWSEKLRELCDSLEVDYYRSPRNLGIPRNMNLGLLQGLAGGYDYVTILNSDVILPANLSDVLVRVAEENERVGSVTAWSNNCSIYSLRNTAPDRYLADTDVVNWIAEILGGEFGPAGVDIPAAVGFCMLIPTAVIREVGLFDPIFNRGYCEELDWCLRAQALGLRNLLAPNTFVYHQGSGSTRDAGLLSAGETTVAAHEQIVDWRYPLVRSQVDAFQSSDIPVLLQRDGLRRIVACAARQRGYDVEGNIVTSEPRTLQRVQVAIDQGFARGCIVARYLGFEAQFAVDHARPILEELERLFERPPECLFLYGRSDITRRLGTEGEDRGVPLVEHISYPPSLGPE